MHGKEDRLGVGVSALYTKLFVQNIFSFLSLNIFSFPLLFRQHVSKGTENACAWMPELWSYSSRMQAAFLC
jgi:hypothetical protein